MRMRGRTARKDRGRRAADKLETKGEDMKSFCGRRLSILAGAVLTPSLFATLAQAQNPSDERPAAAPRGAQVYYVGPMAGSRNRANGRVNPTSGQDSVTRDIRSTPGGSGTAPRV